MFAKALLACLSAVAVLAAPTPVPAPRPQPSLTGRTTIVNPNSFTAHGTNLTPPALRILVLGDSISADCGAVQIAAWCAKFDALLTQAGVDHVIISRAISGVSCGYWADRIATVLSETDPDLVLIKCGTNQDTTTESARNLAGQYWRTIVEASHIYGAQIGISFIQYSNPEINQAAGRGWLVPNEARFNDVVYANLQYYLPFGWFVGLADEQRIPGSLDHLLGGADGIHPNQHGKDEIAVVWYNSLRAGMGWPDIAPTPCGQWGSRPGYPAPEYAPCPFS